MARLIAFLILTALLSLVVTQIADEPGKVVIDWAQYHVETSVLLILAATALFALACLLLYLLAAFIFHSPRSWMRSRLARRQALGLEAITQTLAAIAAQDLPAARKTLEKARDYLPHQPLTLMLAAQVARLEGNESGARLYIEKMLGHEVTEFMALRNLIENARDSGDNQAAIGYGEKAFALKPQDGWLIATLASLYVKTGRLQDAIRLLELSLQKRYITKKVYNREIAQLLYENALTLAAQHRLDSAMAALKESLRKQPDFMHAACLLAELHIRKNEIKPALKVIMRAWKIEPLQELRRHILETLQQPSTRKKFLPYARKIARIHPEHGESRLLIRDLNSFS